MNAAHAGRRLAGFALAGTAALGSAQAATVITGVNIDVVGVGSSPLNLDGVGPVDITFESDSTFYMRTVSATAPGGLVMSGSDVSRLGVETVIGPASSWGGPSATLAVKNPGSTTGQWANQRRGYVGLRFTDTDGGTHYGWVDITARVNPNPAFHVYGYGYETVADRAVSTPTPEPSSIALMALGAAGVLALKRRRRKSA